MVKTYTNNKRTNVERKRRINYQAADIRMERRKRINYQAAGSSFERSGRLHRRAAGDRIERINTPAIIKARMHGEPCSNSCVEGTVVFAPKNRGTLISMTIMGLLHRELSCCPPHHRRWPEGGHLEPSPEYGRNWDWNGFRWPHDFGPHGFPFHHNLICVIGESSAPGCGGGQLNPCSSPCNKIAGIFPVSICDGVIESDFFTDCFRPQDVVGLSVMIFQDPGPFPTPSPFSFPFTPGNSGMWNNMLACGLIKRHFIRV